MSLKISNKLIKSGFEIAKQTNAMLVYWDKDLICRAANNAFTDWFGIDSEEMIDKITAPALLGPLFEENLPYIKKVLDGKVQVFENDIITISGQTRNSIVTYCPDFENEKVNGFYVHVADVTHLKTHSTNLIKKFEIEAPYLSNVEKRLSEVEKTLKASLFTEFPGILKLSKLYFVSESKLKRDFKDKFKTTIFSYYRNLQMQLAEKYIIEKKCSKKEVAVMFNFSNTSNFSICYQKYLNDKNTKKLIDETINDNDKRYQTFITQVPFSLAMLDNKMRYLAASQKWIDDYKLQNKNLTGLSFYEIFPDTKTLWKNIHKECLKGDINRGQDLFFESEDGSSKWLRWDIRPWYRNKKIIGGIIISIEDITALKLKDEENRQKSEILNKTNEIARIGAWERNFRNNTGIWSKITREIFEVADDFEPILENGLSFYKKGSSRNLVKTTLNGALEKGESFDIEVEMITAKGNLKWVRVIGYSEFFNGKCEKLSGIFQDITSYKIGIKKLRL
jgi:PAS domain S-box-containing protein